MNKLSTSIDYIGITLIGIISLGYCLFGNLFAKLSIQLSFLSFPIFIGELLLFATFILFIARWNINREKFYLWHYIVIVYFIFVLIKVLIGYLKWGPLALRHSALFYYPLFAVFGYYFFSDKFFKDKTHIVLLVALLFASIFITDNTSSKFICFLLSIVVLQTYPSSIVKYALLFLIFVFTPYKSFLQYYRTMVVSNVISGVFIACGILWIIKIKRHLKVILCAIVFILFCFALHKTVAKNTLQSIVNLKENIARLKLENEKITILSKDFVTQDIRHVRLYTKQNIFNGDSEVLTDKEKEELQVLQAKIINEQIRSGVSSNKINQESNKQILSRGALDAHYGNNLFRIFIWRDLLEEYYKKKPLFGFDFGKPFRSKSIEILNMAFGEWSRDGWIAVHNSYLETIYRSGIIGIILLITLFLVLYHMIKSAILLKSINGLLLCGLLINWLVSANFMLIFELPYKAIPFWSCFGMSLKYITNIYNNRFKGT